MKLNEKVTLLKTTQFESKQFLTRLVQEIQYAPAPPVEKIPPPITPDELEEFYKSSYVLLDDHGALPPFCNERQIKLSSYEEQLINFCVNPRAETKICVLHGHTGVGKSTLLRRIIYYIYPKCPELRRRFIPIYLRFTPNLESENPDTLFLSLQREIIESIYPNIRDVIRVDIQRILLKLNLQGKFFGRFPKSVIDNVMDLDGEEWINSFFINSDLKNQFLMEVLKHLILEKKIHVVLILDDVDRYSRSVQNCTFWALDTLFLYGLAFIVSMRTSTYSNTSVQLLEYRDHEVELLFTQELIEQVLNRRLELLEQSIHLTPDISYRINEYKEVKGQDVVECFCRLLSRSASMKALVNLSNTNLKSVFQKLALMSKSDAFSDEFIVQQLLERDVVNSRKSSKNRIWIFYHMLLGNHGGTFMSKPETTKASLINLFDSSILSNNKWRHFIRLHILIFVYGFWKKNKDDNRYVKVADVQEAFKSTFGTLIELSLILDTLNALIESELLFTESCRRYFDNPQLLIENIFSDSIQISYAGIFYLENFIHKVEYLYFIKDDIDWSNEIHRKKLKLAHRDYNRPTKFESLLTALKIIHTFEYECLAELNAYWTGSEDGNRAFRCYRDLFSPYTHTYNNEITICDTICYSYETFIKQKMGRAYEHSKVKELIDEIKKTSDDNQGIKRAFLQA